jgi:hypothetical protein
MGLWDDITEWLYAPFTKPVDLLQWVLLLIISATIAYAWSRVLDNVLEE